MHSVKTFSLSFLMIFGAFSSGKSQQSVINATIKGLGRDTVIIEFNPLSKIFNYEDTLLAKDDKFVYRTTVDKPVLIYIKVQKALAPITPANKYYIPHSKRISMVLLPGDTTLINGELSKYSLGYSLNGANINEELSQYHKLEMDKRIKYFMLESSIDSLYKMKQTQEISVLMQKLQEFKSEFRESAVNYIKKNPDKDYSALLLVSSNNPELFGAYINTLDAKVANGLFKEILRERTDLYNNTRNSKHVVEGTKGPLFTATDLTGSRFELSGTQGKYVLLDFWGQLVRSVY